MTYGTPRTSWVCRSSACKRRITPAWNTSVKPAPECHGQPMFRHAWVEFEKDEAWKQRNQVSE